MRASSHIGAAGLALALAFARLALAAPAACGDAQLGESCAERSDCDEDLQCLERVCAPRCQNHIDCGDGYRCERRRRVRAGPVADRRSVRGARSTAARARPARCDRATGTATATWPAPARCRRPAVTIGAAARADDECQSRHLRARPVHPAVPPAAATARPAWTCAVIPRLLEDSAPRFCGCLPGARRGQSTTSPCRCAVADRSASRCRRTRSSFALVAEVDELRPAGRRDARGRA